MGVAALEAEWLRPLEIYCLISPGQTRRRIQMRTLARIVSACVLVFVSLIVVLNGGSAQTISSAGAQAMPSPGVTAVSGTSTGPRIWLQKNQPLPVVHRDAATKSPDGMQGAQP